MKNLKSLAVAALVLFFAVDSKAGKYHGTLTITPNDAISNQNVNYAMQTDLPAGQTRYAYACPWQWSGGSSSTSCFWVKEIGGTAFFDHDVSITIPAPDVRAIYGVGWMLFRVQLFTSTSSRSGVNHETLLDTRYLRVTSPY